MPDTETLAPDQLKEIEVALVRRRESLRFHQSENPGLPEPSYISEIDALCRSLRAAWAEIARLTTQWCECGHEKAQHGFFSDHDECYECDQSSPDLCCEWRPAPRPNEGEVLRQQLATQAESIITLQENEQDSSQV